MERKLVNAIHVLNILFQAIYSLLFPVGVGVALSYVLVEFCGAKTWVWALLLTVGVLIGLVSMVKFILSAARNLERLEKEQAALRAEKQKKAEMQAELRRLSKEKESERDGEQPTE